MLTEAQRKAHNKANLKWRRKNPTYFKDWRAIHMGYRSPSYTPTRESWSKMQQRCYNPNAVQYRWYGARGIKVLYRSFQQFIADVGPRPKGKSIDRIDNNGHYEVGNCRWSIQKEQCNNRRNTIAS